MRPIPGVSLNLSGRVLLAMVRLNRRVRSERVDSALSPVQVSALDSLHQHGTLTPRELAGKERIAPPTMTKLIASLEEADLVARQPHPTDRRQVILRLTPAGAKQLTAEASTTEHWLAKRLDELTGPERDTLAAAIPIIDRMANS
ncbi:MAG TPA: MarR family transcriptional regulator [Pseudonocardia sp.]|jgi:DNA-binding MarR family transcriptional regulator